MVHVYAWAVTICIFLDGFSQDLESKMWSIQFHASPCIVAMMVVCARDGAYRGE